MQEMISALLGLECTGCGADFSADELINTCPTCGRVLFAHYDLEQVSNTLRKEDLSSRETTLWRYKELLPVAAEAVSLGEGLTPVLKAERLGATLGCPHLYIKDEGLNPTGTFKSRGLSVAVSKAKELGAEILAMPSAGNAGAALAAYGAKAGLETWIFLPDSVPEINKLQCQAHAANLVLVDGLIDVAGREAQRMGRDRGWFDVSTLKEPYRVEGKKTMGLEIAEQFSWHLPGVIVYPTGGGTGLIGMWKAFDELGRLGWVTHERPRMVAVQSAGCAPIVKAFEVGVAHAEPWPDARTIAPGLNVPAPFADYLILRAIRESGGAAISVTDEEILASMRDLAREEGILACPEGAATLAGLRRLLASGTVSPSQSILLLNTGTGLIYPELVSVALSRSATGR
jgi:threonine synthase